MSVKKVPSSIRFDAELLYKISFVARENMRSLNAQLEYLALTCVREYEKEHGEIPIDENELYKK